MRLLDRKPDVERMRARRDPASLAEALKHKDAFVRGQAARALGEMGDKGALEPLTQALNDEEAYVRSQAAMALANLGDERAVDPLLRAWTEAVARSNPFTSTVALGRALGRTGDTRAVGPLVQALKEDWHVREAAAIGLGEMGQPAVELLVQALEDEAGQVRQAAQEALARIEEGVSRQG